MKIAVCASEGSPYAKSGGLGDVIEGLPAALSRIEGNEVTLFLPYYNKIKTNTAYEVEKVAEFRVQLGWRQQFCAVMKLTNRKDNVQVYFLDNEYYFGGRTGAIYGDSISDPSSFLIQASSTFTCSDPLKTVWSSYKYD